MRADSSGLCVNSVFAASSAISRWKTSSTKSWMSEEVAASKWAGSPRVCLDLRATLVIGHAGRGDDDRAVERAPDRHPVLGQHQLTRPALDQCRGRGAARRRRAAGCPTPARPARRSRSTESSAHADQHVVDVRPRLGFRRARDRELVLGNQPRIEQKVCETQHSARRAHPPVPCPPSCAHGGRTASPHAGDRRRLRSAVAPGRRRNASRRLGDGFGPAPA